MLARDPCPIGAAVTLQALEHDPHRLLARLRDAEPVSWLPVLGGWLVTRYDLALEVMRDPVRFTVDDPRFTTARVIGPSMLSLDGPEHARHRAPFVAPFRAREVGNRFAHAAAEEAATLVGELARRGGGAELRRSYAGPLAASIVARALGLDRAEVPAVLAWYDAIVASVTALTAGDKLPAEGPQAFAQLRERLRTVIRADGAVVGRESLLASVAAGSALTEDETIANAAVLLFGGIETTEGMIVNAIIHLLEDPERSAHATGDARRMDALIEESLRVEPAAAVIDRYATARTALGGVEISPGDLVRVSISAANRDPAVFSDPDRFDPLRHRRRGQLAFAHGPHVCVGIHLARLEARVALTTLLRGLRGLRLDPERPAAARGLVFRKPLALHVLWG